MLSKFLRNYLDPVWVRDRVREIKGWTHLSKSARGVLINKIYEEHEDIKKKYPPSEYKDG